MRHRIGARVRLHRQRPGHGVRRLVARLAREDALDEAGGLGAVRAIGHLGGALQRGERVRVERERTLEAGQALREAAEPFQRDGADGPEPGIAGPRLQPGVGKTPRLCEASGLQRVRQVVGVRHAGGGDE